MARAVLSPELFSSELFTDILAARRLKRHPDRQALLTLLPKIEEHPMLFRYLADAANELPASIPAAETCRTPAFLAEVNESPEPAKAAEAGEIRSPLVLQTVFYGDPARPGRKGSGGIGSLVLRLGSALGGSGDQALTVAVFDPEESELPPCFERIAPGHELRRFPLTAAAAGAVSFIFRTHRIAAAFEALLDRGEIAPGVIHIRFLDDASLAVARVAARRGIPLVLTLTPDPHRLLVGSDGEIAPITTRESLILLHRIWLGDELLDLARGVVAIGRDTLRTQLIDYFPQLERAEALRTASIDEGVPVSDPADILKGGFSPLPLLTNPDLSLSLEEEHTERPFIVSVGRLAPIKNQPALVRAWTAGLWQTHNLILIGGDLHDPSREEEAIIDEIRQLLDQAHPECRGMAVHLPGQPSDTVTRIESWLAERERAQPGEYPSLYVAPSLKEEFGLAILEAMSAGLVACAPLNGGAGTYLRSGTNGFLIDTRDSRSLGRELGIVLRTLAGDAERVGALKESARRTVRDGYSLEKMAADHSRFYRKLAHG